jgi:short-subunit dehydrogenase
MSLTAQIKTVLITGAASGIGAALLEAYLETGARVIGIDVNETLAQALLEKFSENLSFVYADLSQAQGIQKVLDAVLGIPLDVLIHSAGINYVAPFVGSSLSKQHKVLDINLKAPIVLSQELLKKGHLSKGSSLVFVSSLSHQASYPGAAVYAASKDGLTSFARSLGVALASKGIYVLTVFPGPTRTPHAFEHSPDNSREAKRMPPELLAQKILKAIKTKRSRLVPSFTLQVFATVGTYFPFITERIMVKTLYEKLPDS